MEQLNRVELRGRVGNVRFSQVGERQVCHFGVATNAIYRNSGNQAVETVEWHNCDLWSNKKYPDLSCIRTGMPIYVVGRIKYGRYTDADGVDRYSCDISVQDFECLPATEPLKAESFI